MSFDLAFWEKDAEAVLKSADGISQASAYSDPFSLSEFFPGKSLTFTSNWQHSFIDTYELLELPSLIQSIVRRRKQATC